MRIIAMSDSHGNERIVKEIITANQSADAFIHCGDGAAEFMRYSALSPAAFVCVKGNNDWAVSVAEHKTLSLGEKTFFITHGHRYLSSAGVERLVYAGLENKADVILFGHLHKKILLNDSSPIIINPGSVAQPRDTFASYAVIEIEKGDIKVSFEKA